MSLQKGWIGATPKPYLTLVATLSRRAQILDWQSYPPQTLISMAAAPLSLSSLQAVLMVLPSKPLLSKPYKAPTPVSFVFSFTMAAIGF